MVVYTVGSHLSELYPTIPAGNLSWQPLLKIENSEKITEKTSQKMLDQLGPNYGGLVCR